ncbi:NAD(P)-dependent oxidoreductase [Nocardia sp. NBC_00881]|uniref:NAD(P)-dependent oxidoreductase n=1 Tax=Nocardia sp. NBC_00881 TaxID=2975995 RepID=UPI003864DB59|nr:NAD(P)-dependent oxidoreductase [Nocardia sp. NBC_00881]
MDEPNVLGFIGLGVMGSGMCANLVAKSGHPVVAYDPVAANLDAAVAAGARSGTDVADVARRADTVFLSLPSIDEVESVCIQLVAREARPRRIVDMSTSDVTRTRALAFALAKQDVVFFDAPVARMRQAAREGTLLIMVGASGAQFEELEPLLSCMGTDVVAAGKVGNGQVIKVLNNMVLFVTMNSLAEAMTIGRRAGVDGRLLFETLALGSADSAALRKTGMATLVPDDFPEQAFPTKYAIKDLRLALSLADAEKVEASAASQTMDILARTRDAGLSDAYYPAMIKVIDGRVG